MAITTKLGLMAAVAGGQRVLFAKYNGSPNSTGLWNTTFSLVNVPVPGTLAGTSTAAGVVPTDATTGTPTINAFGAGNTGYIASVSAMCEGGTTGPQRLRVCDLLFKAGAYAFNAAVTLASQPSYSSRISGADYKGTEIWFECVTAFTGNPSVAVTYTNQNGTTGRTTGTVALGANSTSLRAIQLPLQAGDTGVQVINSVTATVATVGTFNILVLRPLLQIMTQNVESGPTLAGPELTELPIVFADSALFVLVQGVLQGFGLESDLELNIING